MIALVWILVSSIREPIAFNAAKNKRTTAVVEKLVKIRKAQEMYRNITGNFASDFDTLTYVLKYDSFMLVKIVGDPDDPNFTGDYEQSTIGKALSNVVGTFVRAYTNAIINTLDIIWYASYPFNDIRTEYIYWYNNRVYILV